MATINTRIDYFPKDQKASHADSLLGLFWLSAIKMLKVINKADETRRTLRRQRYASLLG
ncbi:hypothetical protein [Microvirga aerophila]|jgi:hypothetical protein|uniref:Uncharacterized protein n=1 Tax=Microvirga aerophila TaxID=670291 RepID=A0A512BY92_9HYPH|nr:hypothetical protein [Microvirga aerophila]GEO16926.1 hypothetical protein MAE02_46220 [Microvirga aerophila]